MQKRRVISQIHLKEFQKCQDTCQNLQDFFVCVSFFSGLSYLNAFRIVFEVTLRLNDVSKQHENLINF